MLRTIYTRLSQASVLLPVITGLMQYKSLTPAFRLLFYFFVLSVGFEILGSYCNIVYGNNMPGLHLFTCIEFLTFSAVYYLHFRKSTAIRTIIAANAVLFLIIAVADAFVINNIWSVNTLSRSYSGVSILCYTLIYFYYLFSENFTQYSWQYPMFWISLGALIYFGLDIFYFMLISYLTKEAAGTATFALLTHTTVNIIANCLYARSFRCFRKHTT